MPLWITGLDETVAGGRSYFGEPPGLRAKFQNDFAEGGGALSDRVDFNVFVGTVKAAARGAEDNAGNSHGGEERGVGPSSHARKLARTADMMDGGADALHERRVFGDFISGARTEIGPQRRTKFRVFTFKLREHGPQLCLGAGFGFGGEHAALELESAFRGIAG